MMQKRAVLLLLLLIEAIIITSGVIKSTEGLSFSNALGDEMVLQRSPAKARVWGTCTADNNPCTVDVEIEGYPSKFAATIDANNNFEVYLPAVPAGGPYNITATDNEGATVSLQRVLFGDVYVCSGQSNMEMVVSQTFNASEAIENAENFPNIRLFTVGQGTTSTTPLSEFNTIEQPWVKASSATVGS